MVTCVQTQFKGSLREEMMKNMGGIMMRKNMRGFWFYWKKENWFLKDEMRRKDKVINILLDNFSNHVPEHSNYIMSRNIEVST